MNRIAFVLVSGPQALDLLGPYCVLDWTLNALREVRGLNTVVCYAPKAMQKRLTAHLDGRDILVRPGSDGLSCCETTDRWISEDFPVVGTRILVRPTAPLLSGARIEACAEALEAGDYTDCCLARQVTVLATGGTGYREYSMPSPLSCLRVCAGLRRTFLLRTVEATAIEALDYNDPHERRILQALIESGAV